VAKARAVRLAPDEPFALAAARTVEVRAAEMLDLAANVLDTTDIERVHDMRVATRRLRACLEIFAPCFPRKAHRAALREVKALADALGERRDPDVQLEALAAVAAAMGRDEQSGLRVFGDRLRAEQRAGNAALAAALEHAERAGLRERLDRLVAAARAEAPA
jgi:CHAD domain-containing protein